MPATLRFGKLRSPKVADPDLSQLSRDFIAAAFDVLRKEHVIPTPVFHPFVSVGSDYYGGSVMGLPEYKKLEEELNDAFPHRFAEPLKREHAEFASTYMFSLLEGAIARCGSAGTFAIQSQGVQKSVDEMLEVLASDNYELVCCRAVSHLALDDQEQVQMGPVKVVPPANGSQSFERLIPMEIPGGAAALNRDAPFFYDPPQALLVITGRPPTTPTRTGLSSEFQCNSSAF
jgi:hypothetical protein